MRAAIAEAMIGKPAAWFIVAVMLFSFAVRSVYMESCSMFVRGGVYVVVKDSMGPWMAKFSVSALVVDYVLTGPISGVSAGLYLGHLINEVAEMLHQPLRVSPNYFAAAFAAVVTVYFWWSNTKGIHESSSKALRIMQITTVMVVMMIIWCLITLVVQGNFNLPPAPTLENIHFNDDPKGDALGWLRGTSIPNVYLFALTRERRARRGARDPGARPAPTPEVLARGLADVRWPGRLERVGEDVLLDCAHNVEGAGALAAALPELAGGRPVVLLSSIVRDKDAGAILAALAPRARAHSSRRRREARARSPPSSSNGSRAP